MDSEYRVRLDVFDGPMDLLLHLIRRHEVDIADIPIALIADQFVLHLQQLRADARALDMEQAGDFLVMAATLMEIKSRMIARASDPSAGAEAASDTTEADEPAEDPRAELVRQLLAYRAMREAADGLERRHDEWQRRAPAARILPDKAAIGALREPEQAIDLEDLDLGEIVRAFWRVASAVNFERMGEHEIAEDDAPFELHAADLIDLLEREGYDESRPTHLHDVLRGRSRREMLGLFLALLELLKQQRLGIALRPPAPPKADGALPSETAQADAEPTVVLWLKPPTEAAPAPTDHDAAVEAGVQAAAVEGDQ